MNGHGTPKIARRKFLGNAVLASGLGLVKGLAPSSSAKVAILSDPEDRIASAPPARWAAAELEEALSRRGVAVNHFSRFERNAMFDLWIVVSGTNRALARQLLHKAGVVIPQHDESLALVAGKLYGKDLLLAGGTDARGLEYALLELADRVQYSSAPRDGLRLSRPVIEQPANAVRAINRCFVSNVEDKPWYSDRDFWPAYFSMLAAQRFNRFCLSFGLAYDFTRNITDCYFHFAYPFLTAVPGYDVRAVGLPDEERDRNLQMLRFISDEAVARGLDFQLGLWTHAYQWHDSPHANYTISGLTPETHAGYCRDALHAVLDACPAIRGLALRIHGESGVAEGSYDFWKTLFSAATTSGRTVEINLHAKGIDQRMIDLALATGMPVTVSPKYWAEHIGLPYHQASIREIEKPPRNRQVNKFFSLSSGSRSFLRYSYGDLHEVGRRYGIYTRIWPGTERVLLWGDPVTAAAYARDMQFCGESGVDLFEPLSFKGRRGSGIPGGRCAYADPSLTPRFDWEKFLYTYRVWGRHLYNPDTDPDVSRRFLRKQFRAASPEVESALACASRILPLVTTAYGPSAANNNYWPEIYTNMPIIDTGEKTAYSDTPSPKTFGNASSFDPELFSNANDFVEELLQGRPSGRFSPIDVAQWLEGLAGGANRNLAEARSKAENQKSTDFRRLATDVAIQSGLGLFFAAKFRCAVLYAIFTRAANPAALNEALNAYHRARDAWAGLAEQAKGVYAPDITYGPEKHLRGHWPDRLAGIDDDIAEMEKRRQNPGPEILSQQNFQADRVRRAIQAALGKPSRLPLRWKHVPAQHFQAGAPLDIELEIDPPKGTPKISAVRFHYRHVNQAEDYLVEEMKYSGGPYQNSISGTYTQSPYHMQYFFEVLGDNDTAWPLPGYDPNQPSQPYFVVRQQQAGRD
ncbi:MAG TPA: hypothetical protein VG028_01740 [Terriglobia bacterium]|nr:hypothetical protein [Terriglobia bacterium]